MRTRPGTMDEDVVLDMQRDPYRVRQVVDNDTVVLDGGANIGAFAAFVLSFAPEAKIICVEPLPRNADLCKENLSGASRCSVIQAALTAQEGEVHLHDFGDADSACHTVLEGRLKSTESVSVPATTIESVMSINNLQKIDFLKLDVQGAEFEIIDQCPDEILRDIDYIAMELHPCIRGNSGLIGRTPESEKRVRQLERKLYKTHVLVHGDPSAERLTVTQWKNRRRATSSEKLRSTVRRQCRYAWRLGLRRFIPRWVANRFRQAL